MTTRAQWHGVDGENVNSKTFCAYGVTGSFIGTVYRRVDYRLTMRFIIRGFYSKTVHVRHVFPQNITFIFNIRHYSNCITGNLMKKK